MKIISTIILIFSVSVYHANAEPNCEFQIKEAEEKSIEIIKHCAQTEKKYQNYLGTLYRTGDRVEKNYNAAISWYEKAAKNGYAPAMFNLGNMYRLGVGVSSDNTVAIKWYIRAAELGDSDAQTNLGYMISLGEGIKKDLISAYAWTYAAYKQNNDRAFVNRSVIARKMTEKQIREAEKLGEEYLSKYSR